MSTTIVMLQTALIRLAIVVFGVAALASCANHQKFDPTSSIPLFETASGTLSGDRQDGTIIFKGIPYAAPPVGKLRWAAPQDISWEGIYSATKFPPACQQVVNDDGRPNFGGYAGPVSEDCLYLNIWAPADATGAPVMVWLYGGGGVVGAGSLPSYDGSSFAENGVILVTLNYRHGSLAGFAHPSLTESFGDGKALSNFQLLDSIAALNWVKDNIHAVGGDPSNVTLFGESAGATMTANLVTSPLAKGIFSKAIFESTGSLATPGTPLSKAEKLGIKIATAFNLDQKTATLEALRNIDAAELIRDRKLGFGFRTIIDGNVKEQSILESFEAGTQNNVLLMLGTNSDEGRLYGTRRIADLAEASTPVFHYFFDYVPQALRDKNPNGAPHAGEIPFAFNTLNNYAPTQGSLTKEDRDMAELTHSCWIAFAKAAPNAKTLKCGNGFIWPARQAGNGKPVLVIKPELELSNADALVSPPNGAAPGPSSRDEY